MRSIQHVCLSLILIGALAAAAAAQMSPGMNTAQMKFIQFPGLPTCASGAVTNGDPSKGASIILLKISGGCTVPWHWHTPNEHLMLVSGAGTGEMKAGGKIMLRPGGYALMAASQAHRFTCTSACLMYLYSDGAFDLHYVDAAGKEITPDAALKAVKETPVKAP